MWNLLWTWLKSLLTPKPAVTIPSIPVTTDAGEIAGAVKEVATVADDVIKVENTPQMVQGRLNAEEQAAKDKIAKDSRRALKTGNLEKIDEDLS